MGKIKSICNSDFYTLITIFKILIIFHFITFSQFQVCKMVIGIAFIYENIIIDGQIRVAHNQEERKTSWWLELKGSYAPIKEASKTDK